MTFTSLLDQTATLYRLGATTQDAKGNQSGSYASAGTVATRVWFTKAMEDRDGRWVEVEIAEAVVPAGTNVTSKDRFGCDGRTYEVTGVISIHRASGEHHLHLYLQEYE